MNNRDPTHRIRRAAERLLAVVDRAVAAAKVVEQARAALAREAGRLTGLRVISGEEVPANESGEAAH